MLSYLDNDKRLILIGGEAAALRSALAISLMFQHIEQVAEPYVLFFSSALDEDAFGETCIAHIAKIDTERLRDGAGEDRDLTDAFKEMPVGLYFPQPLCYSFVERGLEASFYNRSLETEGRPISMVIVDGWETIARCTHLEGVQDHLVPLIAFCNLHDLVRKKYPNTLLVVTKDFAALEGSRFGSTAYSQRSDLVLTLAPAAWSSQTPQSLDAVSLVEAAIIKDRQGRTRTETLAFYPGQARLEAIPQSVGGGFHNGNQS